MGIPVFLPVVYRDLSGKWFGVVVEKNRRVTGIVCADLLVSWCKAGSPMEHFCTGNR